MLRLLSRSKKNYEREENNKMVGNREVGVLFKAGRSTGKSNNLQIVDCGDKTLLGGYKWAVYGEREKSSGKVKYHDGWYGYSRTTSKQLGETSLSGEEKTGRKPQITDYSCVKK